MWNINTNILEYNFCTCIIFQYRQKETTSKILFYLSFGSSPRWQGKC
uniref:Uncharacterized protein n=1 Tax=Arundo donax TaxID=35708 RepID=A0A0A8YKL9_ARUDO